MVAQPKKGKPSVKKVEYKIGDRGTRSFRPTVDLDKTKPPKVEKPPRPPRSDR